MYDAITRTFGSGNPTQLFSLCWPGTLLDHDRLSWDADEETSGNMPERALIRVSRLLDTYVPPAPITQPDGTRVSDRYRSAIAQFGPVPDEDLIQLQELVRERLREPVTVIDDGEPRVTTIAEWFERLHQAWARAKGEWGALQHKMITQFRAEHPLDASAAWNEYLRWYANNAAGHIAAVDAAYDRLIAEFPLETWYDALAILDTTASRQLKEAKDLVRNQRTPVPYQEGVDYVPTFGVPYGWPNELRPTSKFLDLLADPQTQEQSVATAIAALQAEIVTWQAILPQVDADAVTEASIAFGKAMSDFLDAQSELRSAWTENAITAAKIFIDIYASKGMPVSSLDTEPTGLVDDANALSTALDKADGTDGGKALTWDAIKEIAEVVGDGLGQVETRQQSVVTTGLALVGAVEKYLDSVGRSSRLGWLAGYVEQLRAKLERLSAAQRSLGSASSVYGGYLADAVAQKGEGNPNLDR